MDQSSGLNNGSAWGRGIPALDVRAITNWTHILRWLNTISELITLGLMVIQLIVIAHLIWNINFENAILWDGSGFTCVFNGATGEIENSTVSK